MVKPPIDNETESVAPKPRTLCYDWPGTPFSDEGRADCSSRSEVQTAKKRFPDAAQHAVVRR